MSHLEPPQAKSSSQTQQDQPACPYCQRRFQNLDDLTLHIVTRHTQSGDRAQPAQSGSRS